DLNKIDEKGNFIISDKFDLPGVIKNLKEEYQVAVKACRKDDPDQINISSPDGSEDSDNPNKPGIPDSPEK
ncbi:MAG: hypothetical protein GX031_06575, partial [Candidatus Riflebacteria bacterium]|nr:hypothetical protein [Candidatus Riflebacteria bacterium]